MRISFFWSEHFLLHHRLLWLLLVINGLGTIYGFQWYSYQIMETIQDSAPWLVLFVPDSPTASLFFTITIVYLLIDHYTVRKSTHAFYLFIRHIVEAFAFITSIKYGIWAVVMIVLGTQQGDAFEWQHAMLIVSHLGMALEAILFARFFKFRTIHIIIIALWTLCNDVIDYREGVFPSLSYRLHPFLPAIRNFTISLSIICIISAIVSKRYRVNEK